MRAFSGGIVVWSSARVRVWELIHPEMRERLRSARREYDNLINGFWLPDSQHVAALMEIRGVRVEHNTEFVMDERLTHHTQSWTLQRMSRGPGYELDDSTRILYQYQYFPQLLGQGTVLYTLDTGARQHNHEFRQMGANDRLGRVNTRVKVPGLMAFIPGVESPISASADADGHGTAVMSCAIGRSLGIAAAATGYAVRVGGANPSSRINIDSVLRGVAAIYQHTQHTTPTTAAPVVLMAGHHGRRNVRPSEVLFHAFESLMHGANAIIVTSSGNEVEDACQHVPGGIPGVVTVGGSGRHDEFMTSGVGPCVSILGPARRAVVASLHDHRATRLMSGTSVAAAYAAGVILTALSENSPLRSVMRTSAQAEAWLRSTGWSGQVHDVPADTPNLLLRTIQRDN
ncbi:hypothetical protein PYCC9005_004125 [Savitreella phatthalungensis]